MKGVDILYLGRQGVLFGESFYCFVCSLGYYIYML